MSVTWLPCNANRIWIPMPKVPEVEGMLEHSEKKIQHVNELTINRAINSELHVAVIGSDIP